MFLGLAWVLLFLLHVHPFLVLLLSPPCLLLLLLSLLLCLRFQLLLASLLPSACPFSGSSCGFVGSCCSSSSSCFWLPFGSPYSSFLSPGAPGLPALSSGVSMGLSTSASGGAPPSTSCGSGFDFAGASGASDSPNDAFLYHGFDDFLEKGEKELPTLGKVDFSKAFHEVVSLITSLSLMQSLVLPLLPRNCFLGWMSSVSVTVEILISF